MVVKIKSFLAFSLVFFLACSSSTSQQKETTSKNNEVKDSCDGPDSDINCCFVNMPDEVSHVMQIADEKEPGDRLVISGIVFLEDGATPCKNAFIYAYHTNNKGIYAKSGKETGYQKWHGKLHGWCQTGADGRYEIHTIRPASYPYSSAPAHIHAAIKLPGGQSPFYIKDFVFLDDPFVDDRYKKSTPYGIGSSGIVDLKKSDVVWHGTRNIIIAE